MEAVSFPVRISRGVRSVEKSALYVSFSRSEVMAPAVNAGVMRRMRARSTEKNMEKI